MDETKLIIPENVAGEICNNTFIEGGSYRLDIGPTIVEYQSFVYAANLYVLGKKEGKNVSLGIIINDLGVPSEKRPKTTGVFELPGEYKQVLRTLGIDEKTVRIFFESTLRNQVRKDVHIALKINEKTGIPVAICANIMGKFYDELAKQGYEKQIGFYSIFKPQMGIARDNACPYGPLKGAIESESGYKPKIAVKIFWVYNGGKIRESNESYCKLGQWMAEQSMQEVSG